MKQFFLAFTIFSMLCLTAGCIDDHGNTQNIASDSVTYETAPLTIITNSGQHYRFTVEVAQTPKQLEYGLMFRESIDDDKGMIFLFPDEAQRGFWMKNTLVFLDMLFVDAQGKIVKIHPMARPHDETAIMSDYPAKAVIEIRGGLAKELGISAGDRVEFKGL